MGRERDAKNCEEESCREHLVEDPLALQLSEARIETAFGKAGSPRPRVNVHSSGHCPSLQELGPGERKPPILGESQAVKSEPAE